MVPPLRSSYLILSFVQHVWDGQYDVPHPAHLVPTIPCREYRWWLRVRTLTFPAPAYTHHFSHSASVLCALGCDNARGDLLHYFTECPHARVARPMPSKLPTQQIGFFNRSMDPHIAAHQATLLCELLRSPRALGTNVTGRLALHDAR